MFDLARMCSSLWQTVWRVCRNPHFYWHFFAFSHTRHPCAYQIFGAYEGNPYFIGISSPFKLHTRQRECAVAGMKIMISGDERIVAMLYSFVTVLFTVNSRFGAYGAGCISDSEIHRIC